MLRAKICLTIFVLYEIVAVILLHIPVTCDAMFGGTFCADSVFKYFIACFAVPGLVGLIAMWVRTVVGRIRRRSFVDRARTALGDIAGDVRREMHGALDRDDLQKYIAAAVVGGIGRYMSRNPRARQVFENIVDVVRDADPRDRDAGARWADYADDDADDEDMPRASRGTSRAARPQSSRRRAGDTAATRRKKQA